jgi:voltage-gated potassium channel
MTASGNSPLRGLPRRPSSLIERRMTKFLREPPSVRLAANVIVTATSLIVVVGGVVMRVVDPNDFSSVWIGMWWVLQTVTTVGYGDNVPKEVVGKILTAAVMLWGVAFLAITTAAITSVFVARAQRERALGEQDKEAPVMAGLVRVDQQLAELSAHTKQLEERLERISNLLERTPPAS